MENDDDNSSNNDSELEQSIIDQKQIRYFKPDQTQLVYDGYIYNFIVKNKNKTSRWRCSTCCGCALVNIHSNTCISFTTLFSIYLKVTKDSIIIKEPAKDGIHIPRTCQQKCETEIQCLIK